MERGFATVCTLSQKRHMGCRLEYWTLGRAELIRTRINLELQEPCAVKVACTVRKGESGGNPANLLGKVFFGKKQVRADKSNQLVSYPLAVTNCELPNKLIFIGL